MKKETRISIFKIAQEWVNIELSEMKSDEVVNQKNFFECTIANWKSVDVDFKADYVSESGSQYMYTTEGVYRKSNHWTLDIATCIWILDGQESLEETVAFCKYEDFKKYGTFKTDRSISENIRKMLRGEMVLAHRIGNIKY